MEKLLNLLNSNPDKTIHFLSGYMISTLFPVPTIGFLASVVAGITKEIYDYHHPNHTCDKWDAIATSLGGALAFLVMNWR